MEPFVLILFGVGGLILLLSFMAMHQRRKRNKRRSRPVQYNNHTHSKMRQDFDDDIGFLSSHLASGSGRSGSTHSRSSGDDHGRRGEREDGFFANAFSRDSSGPSGGGSGSGGLLDD